ncbi:MAG: hypothetical protein WBF53_04460 [Litorimonas sp.]
MKPEIEIVVDAGRYDPVGMRRAFESLPSGMSRKLAVLGDMPALGADELEQHAALSSSLVTNGFVRVFTVGECMRALRGALPRPMRAAHADTPDLIETSLTEELRSGDVVLIKGADRAFGSLAARLETRGAVHAL